MQNYHVSINGIDVDARYSEEEIDRVFLPLLRRLTLLQKEKKRRILVMLAAPPGAGKTTLVSFLEYLSKKEMDLTPVQGIGIDGFHRRQEYLRSHHTLVDNKEVSMVEIKGAPITFDLERLAEKIDVVISGGSCGWPVYDRLLHNPVEDAVTIVGDIVLLEGNYLLLKEKGWEALSEKADFTIFLRADEIMLRERLIERRIKTGVPRDKAERFVDFSDMRNVRLCLRIPGKQTLYYRLAKEGMRYDLVYKRASDGRGHGYCRNDERSGNEGVCVL